MAQVRAIFWFRWVFVGIGLLVAAGTGAWYLAESRAAGAAAAWPQVSGTVVETRVDQRRSRHRNTASSASARRYRYTPVIIYDYRVEGQSYRGERVWLTDDREWPDSRPARAFLADYPPGREVTVRYDPEEPGEAALIVDGPPVWMLLFPVLGLLFVVAGLLLPRFARRPT
ncbi:DUF3592 domain-containing protein [Sphingosinicella terrae]|uniref:DUF3592 domain-containing protein n=1 Tax=Sphingosinicella terrae TaxID=2172047 RepID=UPI0013B3ADF5|nr:DUF3592 domain-containing protein [Sphingosinicella terrae]